MTFNADGRYCGCYKSAAIVIATQYSAAVDKRTRSYRQQLELNNARIHRSIAKCCLKTTSAIVYGKRN